jgi:hypothetical protein
MSSGSTEPCHRDSRQGPTLRHPAAVPCVFVSSGHLARDEVALDPFHPAAAGCADGRGGRPPGFRGETAPARSTRRARAGAPSRRPDVRASRRERDIPVAIPPRPSSRSTRYRPSRAASSGVRMSDRLSVAEGCWKMERLAVHLSALATEVRRASSRHPERSTLARSRRLFPEASRGHRRCKSPPCPRG